MYIDITICTGDIMFCSTIAKLKSEFLCFSMQHVMFSFRAIHPCSCILLAQMQVYPIKCTSL